MWKFYFCTAKVDFSHSKAIKSFSAGAIPRRGVRKSITNATN